MSNVLIYQKAGPSKLAVAFPVTVDFSGMTSLRTEPETVNLCRIAREDGSFMKPLRGDIPLYEGVKKYSYKLDPDRDLNGAGLVYFANFICFLDAAERHVLQSGDSAVPSSLLDSRSTYRRQIGYFGNAEADDSMSIEIAARAAVADQSDHRLMDFSFDYIVTRESDGKIIIVSSSRKVAPVRTKSEHGWADALSSPR
jgi:probable biosynthetic protein (TIGR04098 family)